MDADAAQHAFRSTHTSTFATALRELACSIMVSTYQAGKVVLLRADGDRVNTHFKMFKKPMGLALKGNRLAIGTELEVREFRNVPAVAAKLLPPGKHDACFMPRRASVTGDVQIHDLGLGDELWFVNTRFSCLCTIADDASFTPRWRPSFVSALAPDDRCHLNGLAMVDSKPKYVTALARSDTTQGWRPHKRAGGVVIDVPTSSIVAEGLCMPHSPRWHDGKLWVLSSGVGGFGTIDPVNGAYTEVARLPGFTRGLDFAGRYAFIGLSQVRESAIFGELPITETPVDDRACGVWCVDTVTGKSVGWVKFEGVVQEVFAVIAVPSLRFPELVNDDYDLIAQTFVLPG